MQTSNNLSVAFSSQPSFTFPSKRLPQYNSSKIDCAIKLNRILDNCLRPRSDGRQAAEYEIFVGLKSRYDDAVKTFSLNKTEAATKIEQLAKELSDFDQTVTKYVGDTTLFPIHYHTKPCPLSDIFKENVRKLITIEQKIADAEIKMSFFYNNAIRLEEVRHNIAIHLFPSESTHFNALKRKRFFKIDVFSTGFNAKLKELKIAYSEYCLAPLYQLQKGNFLQKFDVMFKSIHQLETSIPHLTVETFPFDDDDVTLLNDRYIHAHLFLTEPEMEELGLVNDQKKWKAFEKTNKLANATYFAPNRADKFFDDVQMRQMLCQKAYELARTVEQFYCNRQATTLEFFSQDLLLTDCTPQKTYTVTPQPKPYSVPDSIKNLIYSGFIFDYRRRFNEESIGRLLIQINDPETPKRYFELKSACYLITHPQIKTDK